MKKPWIILFVIIAAIVVYVFTQKDIPQASKDNASNKNQMESSLPLDEGPSSSERAGSEKERVSPAQPPSEKPRETALDDIDVQVIHQCARENIPLSSLSMVKSGDQIKDIANLILSGQPLNRVTDIENLHFLDESGEALRFQVLSENESRFFRVDSEGLPIRIDAPKGLQGLSPKEQKRALINSYKTPTFTQTHDRYESPESNVSLQATQENGQIKNLQIFARQNGKVGSLGCAVEDSGSSILCKCF